MFKVLVISDTHVGSVCALIPPNCGYVLNEVQQFLWDKWLQMIEAVGEVDYVLCLGDMVEGLNPKEKGRQTVPDILEQVKLAKLALNMIKCKRSFLFVQGSPYHTGANPSADELLCEILNGEWLDEDGNFIADNIVFHIRHWQPYSKKPEGRYNSQQSESMIMRLNEDNADVILRGHTHRFNFSGNVHNIAISTPCWKSLDKFMRRSSQELPDNGYIIFNVNGSNYSWDQFIFNVPNSMFRKTVRATH